MTEEKLRSWLIISQLPGFGYARFQNLELKVDHLTEIINSDSQQLQALGFNDAQIKAIHQPDESKIEKAIDWLDADKNHHFITLHSASYPGLLKSITSAPLTLFANGDISLLSNLQLAVVGSRNPTRNGYESAFEFSRYLAGTGLTITSGLALGIDAASHLGCLAAGGKTIAVTGNGPDRVYPAKHRELAHQISAEGLLISEFFPGTRPLPQHFPRRNRIISGLSLGTLVVEAALKSGSLITAYKALEQNREVFAIPGSIHNPLARGCHQLIREGAKLVESAQDILEELAPLAQANLQMTENVVTNRDDEPTADALPNSQHQRILEAMAFDPVSVDTLVERTGMTAPEISSILLILELENKITSEGSGHYVRNGHT